MRSLIIALAVSILIACAVRAEAQASKTKPKDPTVKTESSALFLSTAAYAEVALRRAEVLAELESLLAEYTEEYPKIKENRKALELLELESLRLSKVKSSDFDRLTTALGKLMVRKIDFEIDLWRLLQTFKEEHPAVKRAKKKVDVFEAAIKEILN